MCETHTHTHTQRSHTHTHQIPSSHTYTQHAYTHPGRHVHTHHTYECRHTCTCTHAHMDMCDASTTDCCTICMCLYTRFHQHCKAIDMHAVYRLYLCVVRPCIHLGRRGNRTLYLSQQRRFLRPMHKTVTMHII